MNRPNLFIVGAPKSGTTAAYTYLKAHPEIFMSPTKELYYFGDDLHRFHSQRLCEPEYLSFFEGVRNEKWLGEASVSYLVSKLAAQEIHRFEPSARIIIMLRNPVEMMYAMHSQNLSVGKESEVDFSKALLLETARKQGKGILSKDSVADLLFYKELAHYYAQVRRYLEVFGGDNVHIIIFDDFKRDVAGVYKGMLRFLDVEETFQPAKFEIINSNKRRRNERLRQVMVNPDVVATARRLIPSRVVRQRIASKLMFLIVKQEPRSPLDLPLRHQLQQELLPDVEQLSKLLDRDLTHWCQE
jgi:hypothetical protein